MGARRWVGKNQGEAQKGRRVNARSVSINEGLKVVRLGVRKSRPRACGGSPRGPVNIDEGLMAVCRRAFETVVEDQKGAGVRENRGGALGGLATRLATKNEGLEVGCRKVRDGLSEARLG